MFSDPLKLLPLVGYLGAIALLAIAKITFDQFMIIVAASGAGHALISSVNNVNPK